LLSRPWWNLLQSIAVVAVGKWKAFYAFQAPSVNADPTSVLIFGAWCDRQYGFDYTQMRAHHGLAWFPILGSDGELTLEANPHYSASQLQRKKTRSYPEPGLSNELTIYSYLHRNPDAIQWISGPQRTRYLWDDFEP